MDDLSKYNPEGSTLRKAQLRMLDILVEIDKICRRHEISYWIDFGTLLGAVRHKGFIPWDDDLDITILQKDRRKLCRYLKEELPDRYYLFDNNNTDFFRYSGIIKVMDRRSFVKERFISDEDLLKGYGLWVDIFSIEPGSVGYRHFVNRTQGKYQRRIQRHINDGFLKLAVSYVLFPFSLIEIGIYRLFRRMGNRNDCIYDLRTLVASALFSPRHITDIFPLREIEFEGHNFLAPSNYDAVLTETYHDYMQLPPEEKRTVHNLEIEVFD